MISIEIPGFRHLQLKHLVLDYNGTLAVDGALIYGVSQRLTMLASDIKVHVITADTFGDADKQLAGLPVTLSVLLPGDQAQSKRDYVDSLGSDSVFAIGNGRNDREMLKIAAVGVALIQTEGAAALTIANADIVCSSILDALDLLRHPKRLTATLRS